MSSDTVYIVLFRGVGGKTQLPVRHLKAVLETAGFAEVSTYINSGNAVASSSLGAEEATATIARAVREAMAFDKEVILRTREEWAGLIAGNPYAEAVANPTTLHAFVLAEPPAKSAIGALAQKATGTERFTVKGRVLYLHAPDGLGRSTFAPKIETTLKVAMTARNWRTVLALARMAEAI